MTHRAVAPKTSGSNKDFMSWNHLPIVIQNYYGIKVIQMLDTWSRNQDWIVINFCQRIHRWRLIKSEWTPVSATPLHMVAIHEWDGLSDKPIHLGSYLVGGHFIEDVWDTVLSARDPFYMVAFNGHYDPNYVAMLEHRLSHLPTQE